MKTIQFKENGKQYKIAENADDLNIVRFTALRNLTAVKSATMDIPDFLEWTLKRRELYNKSDLHGLAISEYNLVQQLNGMSDKVFSDTEQMIFALMTLEDGEKPEVWDETLAQEKLKRMAEEGLTQGIVWDSVVDFITASPRLYGHYFLMSLAAQAKRKKSFESLDGSTPETTEDTTSLTDLSESGT